VFSNPRCPRLTSPFDFFLRRRGIVSFCNTIYVVIMPGALGTVRWFKQILSLLCLVDETRNVLDPGTPTEAQRAGFTVVRLSLISCYRLACRCRLSAN
jgi:hypothetical protein